MLTFPLLPPWLRTRRWMHPPCFIALYVFFDWVSFIEPLFSLNITPWNPDPAIGLVYWLLVGKRAALPWFIALVLSELVVRGSPAGISPTIILSLWLVVAYGMTGEVLKRKFQHVSITKLRERFFSWLATIFIGLSVSSIGYIILLDIAGMVLPGAFWTAVLRFAIGDMVGVVMTMPLLWMLVSDEDRARLRNVATNWETVGYLALAGSMIFGVFNGALGTREFRHFYLLYLPIVWAATRHGTTGTGLIAFSLQFGIILMFKLGSVDTIPFAELQLLGAVLALVGFFIGVIVDEQRQSAKELQYSLRLAAAGEMAGALAHELNQPVTALAAYGSACEHLLARSEADPLLIDTMRKMVLEAGRTSEVVRRLREFFMTGAMQLETAGVAEIVTSVGDQFSERCRAQGIDLTLSVDPRLSIYADRLQIELVLRNLLANAMDAVLAMPVGQRRITVTTMPRKGNRIEISVQDSGTGVPAAIASRLFEPFVSDKSSGLGLGLALSRAIVVAHGGSLQAEVGDQGVFRLLLPLSNAGRVHVK